MEEIKKCEKCFEKKTLDLFFKQTGAPKGRHGYCKICHKDYKREHYRKYHAKPPRILKPKEHKLEYKKNYYLKNKEILLQKEKLRYEKLKLEHPEILKRYQKNSKPKEYQRRKERYKTDIQFKLTLNLRRRMHKLIKRQERNGSAVKDLGCSFDFFITYIQSKFQSGMTWENYGKWHLDHIYPLSKVDLTNREQFIKVAHYTNYQPLWAKDNISKSDKIIKEKDLKCQQ